MKAVLATALTEADAPLVVADLKRDKRDTGRPRTVGFCSYNCRKHSHYYAYRYLVFMVTRTICLVSGTTTLSGNMGTVLGSCVPLQSTSTLLVWYSRRRRLGSDALSGFVFNCFLLLFACLLVLSFFLSNVAFRYPAAPAAI